MPMIPNLSYTLSSRRKTEGEGYTCPFCKRFINCGSILVDTEAKPRKFLCPFCRRDITKLVDYGELSNQT